jgi:hypothetical protein
MSGGSRGIVALFKSTDENTSNDDRYLSILEENNFTGILIPTLSFQFQTENLRKCLKQPEKYSGVDGFTRLFFIVIAHLIIFLSGQD